MGPNGDVPAFVIQRVGRPDERWVPIKERLFIGRECAGIDDDHRLVIDDPQVSRDHLEIRLDPAFGFAVAVDTSTNGTYVDGLRLARADPTPLKSGAKLVVGSTELEFRSPLFRHSGIIDLRVTDRRVGTSNLILVVGDMIGFTPTSENTPPDLLAQGIDTMFTALHVALRRHRGSLAHYAGDAFFGTWDVDRIGDAATHAVAFALEATAIVTAIAPELPFHDADGRPIRLGWAVVAGTLSVQSMPGGLIAVLGDAANLAFRLAGVAGRDGHGSVIVTDAVADAVTPGFAVGMPSEVRVKGRAEPAVVHEVSAR